MSNHTIKINDRVKFGNVGGYGTVVSTGSEESIVKFDDGDTCRVDSAFLSPA